MSVVIKRLAVFAMLITLVGGPKPAYSAVTFELRNAPNTAFTAYVGDHTGKWTPAQSEVVKEPSGTTSVHIQTADNATLYFLNGNGWSCGTQKTSTGQVHPCEAAAAFTVQIDLGHPDVRIHASTVTGESLGSGLTGPEGFVIVQIQAYANIRYGSGSMQTQRVVKGNTETQMFPNAPSRGDLNWDGKIDGFDHYLLQKAIAAGSVENLEVGMTRADHLRDAILNQSDLEIQTELGPGDLDGDKTITVADAIQILRYIVGFLSLTEVQLIKADTNGDQQIDTLDAVIILRLIIGLPPK